jgi:serine protease Do
MEDSHMADFRRNGHWIIAVIGLVTSVWAVTVLAQRQPVPNAPGAARNPGSALADVPGSADPKGLSTVFRSVSKGALPGIVSIETKGRAIKVGGRRGRGAEESPFGDSHPFGDLFRNDPRFREFFRDQPERELPRQQGMASGFIIDPSGLVLTNGHVVEDAEQVVVRLFDGREYYASEVKSDPLSDVAIIRIKPDVPLTALRLGDSDAEEVGDWVIAVGSPFGLDLTVTAGIISAKGRSPQLNVRGEFLQTDAAINPGNSGGPLLNLNGEVIGINTAISTRSGGYDGVGFAIPINKARWVADQLRAHGLVKRAYLGIMLQDLNNELAQRFSVPLGRGVLVAEVQPDSPADKAKIESGDLIVAINNHPVRSRPHLQSIVEQLQVGKAYPITIVREGKERQLQITLAELPKELARRAQEGEPDAEPEAKSGGPDKFDELGLEVADVTPDVAKQLGLTASAGVLVSSVTVNSPAYLAGLRQGMIIEKVGSKRVASMSDFKDALKDVSLDKGFVVQARSQAGAKFYVLRKEPKPLSR